ncbi:MAG: class I SAM-dependent methyltransferase [Candidatus Binataceae bacterium]
MIKKMNVENFIADCRSQWPEFDDRRSLARSIAPRDRRLKSWLGRIPGMATENKLMLLNLAAAHLEADEVYVEIGCYKGLSVVAVAAGNERARIYACDNFSQFKSSADELRAALAAHTLAGQIEFFDMDFRRFLELAPWRPAKIGVYFYDGGHSFRDQYEALKYAAASLADNAIVIIDDTNKRNVRAANRLFIRRSLGFEPLLDLRTGRNHSPSWWNGIQAHRYRRIPGQDGAPADGPAYWLSRFFWDDVILRGRHAYRARRAGWKARTRKLFNKKNINRSA